MHVARLSLRAPRGVAALALVAVLLFAMSIALLWSGRSLVFAQRAAANQPRQAQAFAAAESGLEWALAKLNDPRPIDPACRPRATGPSFRDRYAVPWVVARADQLAAAGTTHPNGSRALAAIGYAPPAGLRSMCRIEDGTIDCRCPAAPGGVERARAELDAASGARYAIELAAVDGEAHSLWLVARACSSRWSDCDAQATAQTEAQAVVRVQLRWVESDASRPRPRESGGDERNGSLAIVPGSWRDGRCSGRSALDACDFQP